MSSEQPDLNTTTSLWLKRLLIVLTLLAWLVVIGITFWLLGHISDAVILLLLSATIATVLFPIVRRLSTVMPRLLSIALVYTIALIGLGALLYFVINTLVNQLTSLIQFIQSLNQPGNQRLQDIEDVLGRFGITQEQLRASGQQIVGQLQGLVNKIFPFISNFFSFILNFVLITLLSIYFLLSGPRIVRWLREDTPVQSRETIGFLLDTLARVIGGNFRGVLLLALIISSLTWLGLTILHVPYAFLLSVLAFVLEFIPVIGFYITAITMVLFALTQGLTTTLLTLGLALLIQLLEGEVLSPRIIGKSVGVSPIIQIAAIIAGSQLFGILGAFFAAPVVGCIQAICVALWRYWRRKRPDLFRPAL